MRKLETKLERERERERECVCVCVSVNTTLEEMRIKEYKEKGKRSYVLHIAIMGFIYM
jgi:hypothetical protein